MRFFGLRPFKRSAYWNPRCSFGSALQAQRRLHALGIGIASPLAAAHGDAHDVASEWLKRSEKPMKEHEDHEDI